MSIADVYNILVGGVKKWWVDIMDVVCGSEMVVLYIAVEN